LDFIKPFSIDSSIHSISLQSSEPTKSDYNSSLLRKASMSFLNAAYSRTNYLA